MQGTTLETTMFHSCLTLTTVLWTEDSRSPTSSCLVKHQHLEFVWMWDQIFQASQIYKLRFHHRTSLTFKHFLTINSTTSGSTLDRKCHGYQWHQQSNTKMVQIIFRLLYCYYCFIIWSRLRISFPRILYSKQIFPLKR